jgi:steroid 5-alpha reductase family enzyme
MEKNRSRSFLIILLTYVLAVIAGVFVYKLTGSLWEIKGILPKIFIADTVATILVWLVGVYYKNASVYDPYWSVAPPVIMILLAFHLNLISPGSIPPSLVLLLVAVCFWSIRLTANWAYTFRDLGVQDWRYTKFRNDFPGMWQLINFFGIHYMPTLIVFFALLPALVVMENLHTSPDSVGPLNLLTFIGFGVSTGAALLQLVADRQLHRFRRINSGRVCEAGLWKYARHPNYSGEILMWWGVYIMSISVLPFHYWWTGMGAFLNTLMFLFISIPLMEHRQLSNKPEYASYRDRVRALTFIRKSTKT